MHVGAERDVVPLGVQRSADRDACLGVLHPHHGHADQVEALVGAGHDLLDRRLDVARERRSHRLPDQRVVRAELDGARGDGARLAPRHHAKLLAVLGRVAKRAVGDIARG